LSENEGREQIGLLSILGLLSENAHDVVERDECRLEGITLKEELGEFTTVQLTGLPGGDHARKGRNTGLPMLLHLLPVNECVLVGMGSDNW